MLKKILVVCFGIAIIFSVFSCNDKPNSKIKLAIIGRYENSFWNEVSLGAKAAEKDLWVNVEFLVSPKEDPAWQIRKVEELIKRRINGIAFSASDPKSLRPVIMKTIEQDIPCIAIDTDLPKSRHAYIGTGNYYTGQQSAEKMLEIINNKGKVAIISDSSNSDCLQRIQGFRDIIADNKEVKIVEPPGTRVKFAWTSQLESIINSVPELNGIFCVTDTAGISTASAVIEKNKVGKIKIVCIGESKDILKLIQDNVIQAAISRRPYRIGYLSVLVLHNMVKAGIKNTLMILPKSEIIDTGVTIITPSNVIQYYEELTKLGKKHWF